MCRETSVQCLINFVQNSVSSRLTLPSLFYCIEVIQIKPHLGLGNSQQNLAHLRKCLPTKPLPFIGHQGCSCVILKYHTKMLEENSTLQTQENIYIKHIYIEMLMLIFTNRDFPEQAQGFTAACICSSTWH